MKFQHVYFNADFWKGKTEAQFIAHESHHGLSESQLKEAFALMNPPAAVISKSLSVSEDAPELTFDNPIE